MERYEVYKDSGIEWISDIPVDWTCANLGAIAKQRKNPNKDGEVDNVLSLSYGSIRRRVMDNTGLLPESFNTYNVIEDGDVVLRLTDLQNDQRSLRVGLCHEQGIITAAYTTLEPQSIDSRYLFYSLAVFDYWKGFYGLAGGVRQSLTFDGIRSLRFPLPSRIEQQAIADYLDAKTDEIDALVADCEREVGLLQEYRKAVISEAVTKGLDPNAPMKDSGLEWIGRIPEGWLVRPSKTLFAEAKELRHSDDEQCAATQKYGIIPQARYIAIENQRMVVADKNLDAWKHVEPGDFVISLRSFQGGLELSEITGCVTWHYIVLKGNDLVEAGYFKYLFKTTKYIESLQRTCAYIRDGQDLRYSNFVQVPLPLPSREEQVAIGVYLDAKTAEIDSLIEAKQTMADKLREYRKSLISEAVTGKFKVPGV